MKRPRLHDSFLTRPLAHRTLHDIRAGRPENSLAGARAAVLAGYGIEVDLQLSADGVPMVFHDPVLNRLTPDVGPVRDRTADQLAEVRLTYGSEGIPTLANLLAVVQGRVPLLVELKDQTGTLSDAPSGIEDAVADVIAGYTGPIALMSYNPHSVARLAELAPDVARGLVTEAFPPKDWPGVPVERLQELAEIPDYDRVGASFISHDVDHLTDAVVTAIRAKGADLLTWTVRSSTQEATARQTAQNITFENYLPHIPD